MYAILCCTCKILRVCLKYSDIYTSLFRFVSTCRATWNEWTTYRSTVHYHYRSMICLATSLETIRKGEQKTAMKIIQGNMSDSSIFGSTITKCVLSLQVIYCLPEYVNLWGQSRCEEMTVAVSAVVGSILTRNTW